MTRILLTGAGGTLGTALAPRLAAAGHVLRGTSRSPPGGADGVEEWVALELPDEHGLDAAVEGMDVVVHAASDARGDSEAVDVRGTERLVRAAAAAEVDHFVYVSIVGIDDVPFRYYKHKLAAERHVAGSDVPHTIVRLTQFQEFVDLLFGYVAKLPVWPLPTAFRVQPIAAGDAATAVADRVDGAPAGRVPDMGGPEVQTVRALAVSYRRARGRRRPIVKLPIPGATARAFRRGDLTCPGHAVGTRTWEEYLEERYP